MNTKRDTNIGAMRSSLFKPKIDTRLMYFPHHTADTSIRELECAVHHYGSHYDSHDDAQRIHTRQEAFLFDAIVYVRLRKCFCSEENK